MAKNAPYSGTLVTPNDQGQLCGAKPISAGFPETVTIMAGGGSGFYYCPKTQNIHDVRVEHQRAAQLFANLVVSVGIRRRQGNLR